MITRFEMPADKQARLLQIAAETPCTNGIKPERFMRLMQTNNALVAPLHLYGLDEHGLERRNPIIVAFGDSVTAGQFEALFDATDLDTMLEKIKDGLPLQIADLAAVYHEQFRMLLAEKYGHTAVSVINAGIGGDNILSMHRRVYRDVIQHRPDLVIIAGTLNWSDELGTPDDFGAALRHIVQAVKANTEADIILLTPNPISDLLPDNSLDARVQMVRDIAGEEGVSLVDAYKLWGIFTTDRAELRECLANHINHPTAAGHRVYALALMQLFE